MVSELAVLAQDTSATDLQIIVMLNKSSTELFILPELCEHISLYTAKMYGIYHIMKQADCSLIPMTQPPHHSLIIHLISTDQKLDILERRMYIQERCTFLFPSKHGDSEIPTYMSCFTALTEKLAPAQLRSQLMRFLFQYNSASNPFDS